MTETATILKPATTSGAATVTRDDLAAIDRRAAVISQAWARLARAGKHGE